jgi:uncharacterized protein (DUF58 family)
MMRWPCLTSLRKIDARCNDICTFIDTRVVHLEHLIDDDIMAPESMCLQQVALEEMEAERLRLEESLQDAHAAVENARTDADTYKRENRELLANYDDWLNTLVESGGASTTLPEQGQKLIIPAM